MKQTEFNITIVGGGPVGLFLGICLSKLGISCIILEKRTKPVPDSRSLGIHPVSMDLFEKLEIIDEFLEAGIKIRRGIALDDRKILGEIDFSELEIPFSFILACPQFDTEKILTKKFLELNPNGLIIDSEVSNVEQTKDKVTCWYSKDGKSHSLESDYLVGCDGTNSLVRRESGIFFGGKRYPDTYVMGDFEDNTDFGDDAAIFLPKEGLIESFPLPNNMRRWVVKTDDFIPDPSKESLIKLIRQRINHDLVEMGNTMISSFGVQNFEAEFFIKERILLSGDAAHVVSPIGGQGMNLGWLGAWYLAQTLNEVSQNLIPAQQLFSDYQKNQKQRVRKAARRAEWNMRLGRKRRIPFLKKWLVMVLLKTPLRKEAAKQFTMQRIN